MAVLGEYRAELQFTPTGDVAYTLTQGSVVWKRDKIHLTMGETKAESELWLGGQPNRL